MAQRNGAPQAITPAKRLKQPWQQRLQYSTKLSNALPPDLLGLPHWGTFRMAWNTETNHLDKTPVAGFSSTDPATHLTHRAASDALQRRRGDVLGFALPADRSITLIDLDGARNPDTGEIALWAHPYLERFRNTYIESSPSGSGFHILSRGHKPAGQARCARTMPDGGKIEIYDHDRLVTVTGDRHGDASTLAEMQGEIDALCAELFPAKPAPTAPARDSAPLALDDRALLAKASNPKTPAGRDFAALWAGDTSAYEGDESRADFALAKNLAWWARHDAARVERLMRSSGLAREKWDTRRGEITYLTQTIEKAISSLGTRMYSGATGDFGGCHLDTSENAAPAQETTGATGSKNGNACCAAKDRVIAQLQRELAKERARVKQLEGELAWERKLRANKKLSPAQRIVGSALREQWKKATAKGATEEMPVHLPTLAKQAGMSERTVSAAIQQFHTMGAAKRDPRPVVAQSGPNAGRLVTHLFVDPRPLLKSPEKLQPEKPRNHGGRRVCPECGSKHLRVKIHALMTCMECGNKWETESAERILRGDEDEMAAASDAMLAEVGFSADKNCAPYSVETNKAEILSPPADERREGVG